MPSSTVVGGIATFYWHLLSTFDCPGQVWITSTFSDRVPSRHGAIVHTFTAEFVKRRITRFARLLQIPRALWFRFAAGLLVAWYMRLGQVYVETPDYGADGIAVALLKVLFPSRIFLHVRAHGPSGWNRHDGSIAMRNCGRGLSRLYYPLEQLLFRVADVVTAPTHYMASIVGSRMRSIPRVVLNPFSATLVREVAARSAEALAQEPDVRSSARIVFLGTWLRTKGADEFRQLVQDAGLANSDALVLGSDPTHSCPFRREVLAYEQLLGFLALNKPVVFVGGIHESFGYALLDAAAAGALVYARDTPATRELVNAFQLRDVVLFRDVSAEELARILHSPPSSSAPGSFTGNEYVDAVCARGRPS